MIVINPIMGGGLSLAKLQAATATAADVVTGKTFFSEYKILKTGNLTPRKVSSGTVQLKNGVTSVNSGFYPIAGVVALEEVVLCYSFNGYIWSSIIDENFGYRMSVSSSSNGISISSNYVGSAKYFIVG